MEVRGERRGFIETMRAFFTTIRKRIGQRRTRQRTNNYRICRNLAMAKIESKAERRLKKSKVTKGNNLANVKAELTSTKRQNQEEDGAPKGLRERMLSALRAFREGRKPHWIGRRGWRKNVDGLAMEDLQETQDRVDIQTQDREKVLSQPCPATQAGVDIQQVVEDLHGTQINSVTLSGEDQAKEDLSPAEPASWVVAYGQMWLKMGNPHEMSQDDRENFHITQSMEDTQATEPASWVVAYGQMWQIMVHQDPVLCVEDCNDTQARESLDDILAREGLEAVEPASWFVANAQVWENTYKEDNSVIHSTAIMNSLLSFENMHDWEKTCPYKHMDML